MLRSTGRHYYTGASIALKGERKILSQTEWVDKKRTERPTDFAPPTNYDKGAKKQIGKRVAEAGMETCMYVTSNCTLKSRLGFFKFSMSYEVNRLIET